MYQPFVSSCRFYRLRATGQNFRYSGVNCALGLSKSIHDSGHFVIAGFVIVGFVSTYFTAILPSFHMLSIITGLHYSGLRYSRVPLYLSRVSLFTVIVIVSSHTGRARTIYKGLFNWLNKAIGTQHKQNP